MDSAFLRFGRDTMPDPSLGFELGHQALNSSSEPPPSRDCANVEFHLCAAGSRQLAIHLLTRWPDQDLVA
jgi:hypothetical protein